MKKYSKKLSHIFEIGSHTKIISGDVIIEVSEKNELMVHFKLNPDDIKNVFLVNQSKTYTTEISNPLNIEICVKIIQHCEFELIEELNRIVREMHYNHNNSWKENYESAAKENNITEFLSCGSYKKIENL